MPKSKKPEFEPSPSAEAVVVVEGTEPSLDVAAPPSRTRRRKVKRVVEEAPEESVGEPPAVAQLTPAREPDSAEMVSNSTAASPLTEEPATKSQGARGRKPKADSVPTLGELAERYLASLEAAGKSDSTIGAYKSDLAVATRVLGADLAIDTITPGDVQRFNASEAVTVSRSGQPKAGPTVERTRRVLRLALDYAEAEGWITISPCCERTASAN